MFIHLDASWLLFFGYIPETFWYGRFDVLGKMVQLEETNIGIALATVRLGDEEMGHFLTQKSAKIKRVGYTQMEPLLAEDGQQYGDGPAFHLLLTLFD